MGFHKGSSEFHHSVVHAPYVERQKLYGIDCTVCHQTILVGDDVDLRGFVCQSCKSAPLAKFFVAIAQIASERVAEKKAAAATKSRKANAEKPLTIVYREAEGDEITYYILSGEIIYAARIENGAPCGCKSDNGSACASYYYCHGEKRCKHTDLALLTEAERSTDHQQHVRDDIHSCILCGRRMKVDGWCGC